MNILSTPRRMFRLSWPSCTARMATLSVVLVPLLQAQAQAQTAASTTSTPTLDEVVVSASRSEQRQFDAAASVNSVRIDPFKAATPLVNISDVLGGVPGLQVRERQNYAQDVQISVRGFGTRSTFGVRGVRILIDGIPATNPDGQGQIATASLTSAQRVEVLRGPVAQLYGNAAGGVIQVFTADPPRTGGPAQARLAVGTGSDNEHTANANVAFGGPALGGIVDISHFETDGYRDHSAAQRTQFNGKIVARPTSDTTITSVLNIFDQPLSLDPLGLTRTQFETAPRQVVDNARQFDTRKTIQQQQLGIVLEHIASPTDSVLARLYGGNREVFQTLGFSGAALTSSGGVVDLDSTYQGAGVSWSHRIPGVAPIKWTLGVDADYLRQHRQGFVNNNGTPGALRRNEQNRANNVDLYGQVDWAFAQRWNVTAGLRNSRVRFSVADSPLSYRNTSPVIGLIWHASDNLNIYGNLGRGFETPTLAETAYRAGAVGPNLSLQPSRSTQGEIGMKYSSGAQRLDFAVFNARSKDEIVPASVENGRSIYQNVDAVQRRGIEASWQTTARPFTTRLSYTLLDASFRNSFISGAGTVVNAGNRLPGAPRHSLFAQASYQVIEPMTVALEMRAESRTNVNDANTDQASGYAVLNASGGYTLHAAQTPIYFFARLDNLLDKRYAGSVIVNDSNGRFFEPAAGRRGFIGVRTQF